MARLLLIGLDSADIEYLRAHAHRLPTMMALMKAWPTSRLAARSLSLSGAAWPSFATGWAPGDHGLYYPMQWDPASMALRRVSPRWRSLTPFWARFARDNVPVLAIDVPWTIAPAVDIGDEVIDWGVQGHLGPFRTNRPDLKRAIEARIGRYPAPADVPLLRSTAQMERLADSLVEGARRRSIMAQWLIQASNWQFGLIVFSEIHRAGHALWANRDGPDDATPPDALQRVYEAADAGLRDILNVIGADDVIVVFSLDGLGQNRSQLQVLPEALDRIIRAHNGEHVAGAARAAPNPISSLRSIVPAGIQLALAERVPDAVRDWIVSRSYVSGRNWEKTPAFTIPSANEGLIRLNRAGRETNGVVDETSARAFIAIARRKLFGLARAEDGARLVAEIVNVQTECPGKEQRFLPDLAVLWTDVPPVSAVVSDELGRFETPMRTGRGGNHRPDGFAIVVNGPASAPPLTTVADFPAFCYAVLGL